MRYVIAIIGAGFSGTALAINLLRRPPAVPTDVVLIERGAAMSRGAAFASHPWPFLLNVPAARLSADPADSKSFLHFARRQLPEVHGEDFLPRALYGDYLQTLLSEAEAAAADDVALKRLRAEAVDVVPIARGFEVKLKVGAPLLADQVILAVGIPEARPPEWSRDLRSSARYQNHPWDLPLGDFKSVLIVGNGLTMVDTVLTLSERQPAPTIYTLSRRGILPQPQSTFSPAVPKGAERLLSVAGSVRQLLRVSRSLGEQITASGGDWRELLTLLRQLAPSLWQQLPLAERRRFLRHLQVFWDTHRHRMPPKLAERVADLRRQGRLHIQAGRIQHAALSDAGVRVTWCRRGQSRPETSTVDLLINATGPDSRLDRSLDPLLRALTARGMVEPDALQLGISTGAAGQCLAGSRTTQRTLYYLGPLLRADHWEATAVPELKAHADKLAAALVACAAATTS